MSSTTPASVSAPVVDKNVVINQKTEKSKSKEQVFTLKTPKGTKDWSDKDMIVRSAIFEHLTHIFKSHGGVTIDTPVFELREILSGKYGEDSKLIYNLEDQGGELTSLRYDLTVPFARFVAMNGISMIKRYHIAKVYRRDQPAMTKGRMREFYQCDFDIAGQFDSMVPDAEMMKILVSGLTGLGIEEFKIKLNHRKILDGIFQVCGVKDEDVRKVSSAVDKLDKSPWDVVKKEMVVDKNQPEEVADKIGNYVKIKGSIRDVLATLSADETIMANESAKTGIEEITTMADYLEAFNVDKYISFDMSLARGLDYYTGVIYEAVTEQSAPPSDANEKKEKAKAKAKKSKDGDDDASEYVGVGSIAAGGRYDNLVGMFLGTNSKGKKAPSIPCVGVSFGVERLFSLIKQRQDLIEKIRPTSTQVYIMAFGGGEGWDGFLAERMKIASLLWDAGIESEYLYKKKANPRKQFDSAEKSGCPIAVILGKEEYPKGEIRIKVLGQGEENEGDLIKIENLIDVVSEKLADLKVNGLSDVERLLKKQ
ncbi:Cytoplasmic and mitochondrial histidine tRNA synthetase [Pichia californica]|nr:Cytoplasmic and mitochondrial histidine tRNA synthetase [[Candida] californica]